jgi:transmembrane sensor
MTNKQSKGFVSIHEQAADWLLELGEPTVSEQKRRQFLKWLQQSPHHVSEFLEVAALEQEIAGQSVSVTEILQELKAADELVVPRIGAIAPAAGAHRPGAQRQWQYFALAGAASAALAAFFLLRGPMIEPSVTVHKTELGEQRSIALNDGSIVTLNTLSEATVTFDDHTRRVTLIAGEAMFDVVQDQERHFLVETDLISLRVIGTRFSVYRTPQSVRVAVIDGTVSARAVRGPGADTVLHQGEGAEIDELGRISRVESLSVEKAVAWTERRLIFDNAPLADVVSEFNRYNRLPLVIEDDELANRQITTVFNAHDVSALIGFLQLQPDIDVLYGADAIRIRTERL